MSLAQLLRPRSMAIVGATDRTHVGSTVIANALGLGFRGEVWPVNPGRQTVAGKRCYASVGSLPHPPDVAVMLVSSDRLLGAIGAAIEAGVRNFVVPGAGATDSGELGKELLAELSRLGAQGIQIVGPNCMGVLDLVTSSALYVGTVPASVRRGPVGLIAQSGAVAEAFVNSGGRVALSTVVSSGSEATLDVCDYLDFFAEDASTTTVLAHLEHVTDGRRFAMAVARLLERGKRLAVCKVGRSALGAEGVAAHSGRLAGSHRVTIAALRQAGVIVCDDLDQLMAVGELFSHGAREYGPRLHIAVNSGGEGSLLADIASDEGLTIPPLSAAARSRLAARWPHFATRNPLDPWGVDDPEVVYAEALRTLAAESGDVLVLSHDQQRASGEYENRLAVDLVELLADAADAAGRPAIVISPLGDEPNDEVKRRCIESGIPLLRGARPSLAALGAVVRSRSAGSGIRPGRRASASLGAAPDEHRTLERLAGFGLDCVDRYLVAEIDQALRAADKLEYPVVLKGNAAGLEHKTELGLVIPNVRDADELHESYSAIHRRAQGAGLDVEVLVARHESASLEVLVGFIRDAVFGPCTLIGLGGVWAETIDAVEIHVGQCGPKDAKALARRGVVGRLLHENRRGPLDVDGVQRALVAVSELGAAFGDIAAIDVNPVMVSRDRAVAVDALISVV